MAQKRMFDKRVIESDKFIDLPNSSKALYFMAGMDADDRGFFQPRKLQKMCGFSDDDFKILIAKGLFITFESGVVVITDWNKNNWLDNRRLTETEYVDELNMLKLVNNKYELNDCLADAKPMLSQYSIEENSIDNNKEDNNKINKKESDSEIISDYYQQEMGQLPSPNQYEKLYYYLDKLDVSLIKHSIDIAVNNNVKKMSYIESILKDYVNKGYKSINDLEETSKTIKKDEEYNSTIDNATMEELDNFMEDFYKN